MFISCRCRGESQSIALTLLDKSTNQYGVGVKDKNGVDHFTSRPYQGDMVRMDKKRDERPAGMQCDD
ncbi:hypothetical protein P4W15_00580 [Morganella morganii]|nr:hypothetical protein [Morganella morganii]